MKFFLDTANLNEIREGVSLGVVDGVTTNPSLVAMPFKVMQQLIKHPLTDKGLDQFLADWRKLGSK